MIIKSSLNIHALNDTLGANNAPSYTTTWDTTDLYNSAVEDSSRTFRVIGRGAFTTLDITDVLYFKDKPNNPEAVIATWHVTHCMPQNQSGWNDSLARLVSSKEERNAATFNVYRPAIVDVPSPLVISMNQPDTRAANQSLTLTLNKPERKGFQISSADPNKNTYVKKSNANIREKDNAGCTLVSVKATGNDLRTVRSPTAGKSTYRLEFSIRAQQ